MKKIILVLITLLLALTMVGCGQKEEEAAGEPVTIKFALSTLFIVPNEEATKVVEDDLNAKLAALGKNYKVDLDIISIGDYFTTVPMQLAGGGEDAPDIVQEFSLASDVSSGYIISLEDYLDAELKDTVELIGNVIGSGKLDGETYMIPRFFGTVLDWKFIYNKAMVEDAGVDVSKINSMESLGEVLAELKTAYPEEHFLVYADQFPAIYSYEQNVSQLGTYGATVGEDTTIVNYYETEAYKEAIQTAYEWRQAGYLDPEGSANTASHDAVVMSGAAKGVIMGHSAPESATALQFDKTNTYGAEFGAKTICIGDLYTDTLGVAISYTCEHPAEAADFINLLYCNDDIWFTVIYGSEGQDYVWNEDHSAVRYPDGLDFNTTPYNLLYSCGMIGNGFRALTFEDSVDSGSDPEYGKKLMGMAWCPPLYGFTPTTFNVANQAAAVSNVVDQYADALAFGDVNPAEYYPQFIQALKDAGIDDIIAEFNVQAEAWIAANK